MNRQLLLRYLAEYRRQSAADRAAFLQERAERETLAAAVQDYTQERLLRMTEEEFYDLIAPLWAMAMWGNKHYQVGNVVEANGMELLRRQFASLLYGAAPLAKRWDEFRSKVKGVGPAIMSELLCKRYPDRCLLWNRRTYQAFHLLEVPDLPRFEARLTGATYEQLSERGRAMAACAAEAGFGEVTDLLSLNTFFWELTRHAEPAAKEPDAAAELAPKGKKEAEFVHNDIRDKLADIGRFLGFRAEVEKKVAAGAVVDAVWEVTIGNMGRVIYVFEVQTSGSIDSLILNLLRARNNKAVQGIVAVSDPGQIERIKKEVAEMREIRDDIKYWDYTEVLRTYESLQAVNESINNLGLVPTGW